MILKIMQINFIKIGLIFLFFSCNKNDYSATEQLEIDDQQILEFMRNKMIDDNGMLVDAKTPNDSIAYKKQSKGIYYVITEETENVNPSNSDKVMINYEGFMIKNEIRFEKKGDYILGLREGAINGLKNFIPRLQIKGGTGYVFISSTNGYGNFENKETEVTVPKNTSLYFYVELLDIII